MDNLKKTTALLVAIIMLAVLFPFASVPSYAKSITVKPQGKVSAKLYGYNDIYVSWKKQTVKGTSVRYKVEYKESAWDEYNVLVSRTKKNNCRQADFEGGNHTNSRSLLMSRKMELSIQGRQAILHLFIP